MQGEKHVERSEMTRVVRAAVVQLNSRQDVSENLAACEHWVAEAAKAGAVLVALPENFALMGPEPAKLAIAETLDAQAPGPILGRMIELARRHRIFLVCGGMSERTTDPTKCHNASVLLDPEGSIVSIYRKSHMFDVALPGRAMYQESQVYVPGPGPVVASTPFGKIGFGVCYDLRFPELYRAEVARGARIIAHTAAFTAATGRDHWHLLLRARAVENLCFVLAANQCGRHGFKYETYGHSLIVDPWGRILADAGDAPGMVWADLDLETQTRQREEMPCLQHRRITTVT